MPELAATALPLDEQQHKQLQDAVSGLTTAQLQWVSGFAAGLAASGASLSKSAERTSETDRPQLTVLVGSQTGNGDGIARQLVTLAQDRGFAASTVNLADFKPAALKRESLVTLIVSTHGEGDPPDDAELFHEYLMSDKVGCLAGLRFSVLALGDSSYVNFCQAGRELDERLADLGATRFADLVECDLDFDQAATAWSANIVEALPSLLDREPGPAGPTLHAVAARPAYDRANPYSAEILANQRITGSGSSKDVRHIELSLEGSGLSYEPGDSLAVITSNPPQLVDEFLDVLNLAAEEPVEVDGATRSLRTAMQASLDITVLSLPFLRQWAALGNCDALHTMLESSDPEPLAEFVGSHQIIDIVRRYPSVVDAQTFAGMLRKLSPRSYSIASSLAANPGEVHLTVAAVRYQAFGRPHWGAASTMLADRLTVGAKVPVFIETNPRFRLPDPDTPIIMIGPGTGVAAFRAFVEERAEQRAPGGNWLFFGDRTFRNDFLYQIEWLRHLKRGTLDRLDVAFSRDQHSKVYVQDRLRERGAELYRWIERGAVIYVCGDAKCMAGDVEATLVEVLAEHGGTDHGAAAARLKSMRHERCYQRDVY